MDLLSIGNLSTYMKNVKLQTQWDLKQRTGNYTAKGKSLDEWLDSSLKQNQEAAGVQAQVDAQRENGDDKLREIHQKLEAGSKLTREEREYLQAKDPQAYQELVQEEQQQKAYEQALRRCRTQEEVQRLQTQQINASLTVVRSIEHNPHISQAKKLEIAMGEKRKVDAVAESTRRFVASGEYAKLPTQAEEAQASQDREPVEQPQESQGAQDPVQSQTGETVPSTSSEEPGEKPEGIDPPHREHLSSKRPVEKGESETPEERKVRRAKARAAYAAMSGTASLQPEGASPTFDKKG
ncbi:MAG: hypothetical protein ACOYJZ_07545 [Acutalibacter sp.]